MIGALLFLLQESEGDLPPSPPAAQGGEQYFLTLVLPGQTNPYLPAGFGSRALVLPREAEVSPPEDPGGMPTPCTSAPTLPHHPHPLLPSCFGDSVPEG